MSAFKTLCQNKNWIIELRNDLKEVVFIPKGLGNPCYGFLNKEKDGFKFDHVPPKYIQKFALPKLLKAGMKSIYID